MFLWMQSIDLFPDFLTHFFFFTPLRWTSSSPPRKKNTFRDSRIWTFFLYWRTNSGKIELRHNIFEFVNFFYVINSVHITIIYFCWGLTMVGAPHPPKFVAKLVRRLLTFRVRIPSKNFFFKFFIFKFLNKICLR